LCSGKCLRGIKLGLIERLFGELEQVEEIVGERSEAARRWPESALLSLA
jgi:hypothetical protein